MENSGQNGRIVAVEASAPGNTSGVAYDMYIPNSVDSNTPINLYVCGSGGNELDSPFSEGVSPKFDYNSESIIIVPRLGCGSSFDGTMTITDAVINQYNLNPNNVSISGFSAGSQTAGNIAYLSATGDYNTKIGTYVSVDGRNVYDLSNKAEILSAFKSNNTRMVVVTRDGGFGFDDNRAMAAEYAAMGGEAYEFHARTGLNIDHQDLNHLTYNTHLYDILGSAGDMINSDVYNIYKYNQDGTKSEVSYDEFVKLASLNSIYDAIRITDAGKVEVGTVESDNNELHQYISNMHRIIEKSEALTTTVKALLSTTQTPLNTQELIINTFLNKNTELLSKIVTDSNYVLSIGDKIEEMDEKLKARLESVRPANELEEGTTAVNSSNMVGHTVIGMAAGGMLGYTAAKIGATLGTAVAPGVGTVIGAAIGGVIGIAFSLIGNYISNNSSNSSTTSTTASSSTSDTTLTNNVDDVASRSML